MNLDNRRKFFAAYAEEMQFDPSSIEGWKKVSTADVIAKKVSFRYPSPVTGSPNLLHLFTFFG